MSTIVRYEGNGAETQFPYSFPNFNDKYNELESRVVDANNGVVAGYVITLLEGIATVTPAPKADEFVEIYIKLEETPVTEFNRSTHRITEDNLNDSIYQNLTTAQAALDGRSKNRQVPEDMNGQRVINVAQGVNPGDAVNVQQLSDNIGNIDALVQRAEDAADESELYRDESLAASVDSANSAAAALVSETNAAASEARANTMYKGEWETDYPNGTDTGYLIGDTVLYQNNQYKSIVNNNTSVPTATLNTEWLFYLPGAISSEAQTASFFQTYLQGDGVETDFDLTAINPTWTPKIDDNVFLVLVNGETDLDWTIVVNQDGHSILRFLTAPAESNDTNKNNIFVVGGSPIISDIPRDPKTTLFVNENGVIEGREDMTLPRKDTVYYGGEEDASVQYVVTNTSNVTFDYSTNSYTGNGGSGFIYARSAESIDVSGDDTIHQVDFTLNALDGGLIGQGATQGGDLAIDVRVTAAGKFLLNLSSNGSTRDIAQDVPGTHTVNTATDYLVKVYKTPTTWNLDYSLDEGQNWVNDITVNSTLNLYGGGVRPGFMAGLQGTDVFMNGTLRLKNTFVYSKGKYLVRPQDTEYELNTIVWKGKARATDNTKDLSSNTFIRSPIVNEYVTPVMTAASQDGYIASASTELDAARAAYKAFNRIKGDSNQRWVTQQFQAVPSWLQLELPSPRAIRGYKLFTWNVADAPKSWTLKASNTGSFTGEEVIVHTVTNETNWATSEGRAFSFSNDIKYKYYRFDITANNGDAYVSIVDLHITEHTYIDDTAYFFIGEDSTGNLTLDYCDNAEGDDLAIITGNKRRIAKIPVDDDGDLFPVKITGDKRLLCEYHTQIGEENGTTTTFSPKKFTAPPNSRIIAGVGGNNSVGSRGIFFSYDGINISAQIINFSSSDYKLQQFEATLNDNSELLVKNQLLSNETNTAFITQAYYDERDD